FFLETPSNPTLEVIDIAAVAAISQRAGAMLVVDNVFATPVLQKPLELGADIVVYSGTKHIDGQGRVLGGAILGSEAFKEDNLKPMLRHTGPTLSPFNAWVMLKGLETLKLRVEAQSASALKVASALEAMDAVSRVWYPGLPSHPQYELCQRQMKAGSTLIAFEIKGGKKAAFRAMAALRIIDISNNLGDAKSLITHPASTTHRAIGDKARAEMGISGSLLRLSAGLEDTTDLIGDLEQAFRS
ncbi:MAG TPA: O-succinylhomoserine sulfhydrylase, partial [Rhizobiales bacterium]|nr:O-succinylhomoserine sulfhydrylase [Hyphomicrobiales bacterium]